MFGISREGIPDSLSKTITFTALEQLGLTQEDFADLDANLLAHGYTGILDITSVTVIGSIVVNVSPRWGSGNGAIQFTRNDRTQTIDVIGIPTNIVGGAIKNILRIDISERAKTLPEEAAVTESVETTGSTEDEQTGPN